VDFFNGGGGKKGAFGCLAGGRGNPTVGGGGGGGKTSFPGGPRGGLGRGKPPGPRRPSRPPTPPGDPVTMGALANGGGGGGNKTRLNCRGRGKGPPGGEKTKKIPLQSHWEHQPTPAVVGKGGGAFKETRGEWAPCLWGPPGLLSRGVPDGPPRGGNTGPGPNPGWAGFSRPVGQTFGGGGNKWGGGGGAFGFFSKGGWGGGVGTIGGARGGAKNLTGGAPPAGGRGRQVELFCSRRGGTSQNTKKNNVRRWGFGRGVRRPHGGNPKKGGRGVGGGGPRNTHNKTKISTPPTARGGAGGVVRGAGGADAGVCNRGGAKKNKKPPQPTDESTQRATSDSTPKTCVGGTRGWWGDWGGAFPPGLENEKGPPP